MFSPGFRRCAPTSLFARRKAPCKLGGGSCGAASAPALFFVLAGQPESLLSMWPTGTKKAGLQTGFHHLVCGEKGIRTLDTLLEYTRFPGVPLKPLEHLSEWDSKDNTFFHIFVCYD